MCWAATVRLGAGVAGAKAVTVSPRATAWGAYREITSALRERIGSGTFAPGSPVPSEAALCKEFGVARNTLRRALEQLTEEGVIVTRPGRGRVVAPADGSASAGPQHRQIADDLRKLIESGELRSGDILPSEAALAERYGTSRDTVRRALAELEGTDLVRPVQGKGRFVR